MELENIDTEPVVKDAVADDVRPSVLIARSPIPKLDRPTFSYQRPSPNNKKTDPAHFHEGEYNFVDIGLAEDTDSLLYQANFKRLALGIKAGWSFASRDQKNLDYIKRRISEIEMAQGQTFWSLIVEILSNLFRYHNCFLIKARDKSASSGKVRTTSSGDMIPVAGYFVASPETMRFKVGKNYNIIAYKHIMPDGRSKIFPAEDVVHFHVYRKTHHLTGTPSWIPVLDDVMALRRIEEHVENLVYQHIYPLYQYRIGTENKPMKRFEDGATEIDIVKKRIQDMPSDGMIFTPERHEILPLTSASRAVRAEGFLDHFKKRVVAGSGMSQLDFGDGDTSNRSTADSMSKLASDNVKFYQQNLSDTINFEIVRELMAEATFQYDHSDEATRVEMVFNEIDLEAQIKMQNHFMLLYQGNVHTESEMRKNMGKDPLTDEHRDDMHLQRIDKQKADWNAQANIDKVNAQAQNKQQPTNQHGTKSGPSGRKSSVEDSRVSETYTQLAEDVKQLRGRSNINVGYVGSVFRTTAERLKRLISPELEDAAYRGIKGYPLTQKLRLKLQSIATVVKEEAFEDIDKLLRQASVQTISQLITKTEDSFAIDKLSYRIDFIEKTKIHKTYILAKAAAMKENGVSYVRVIASQDSDHYHTYDGLVIELKGSVPTDLPPFRPNCECDIEEVPNV